MKLNKKPLYVSIYEKIHDMILNGELKPGDQLLGEVELSKKFNVSRSTLRQALLILKENGNIYNIQGKGNFVSETNHHIKDGLEKLVPIPVSFSKGNIEEKVISVVYEVPNNYISKQLQLDKSTVVMNCHKTYSVNDIVSCYSLYMIPINILEKYDVDLKVKQNISNFLEHQLINIATKSNARIVVTQVGEFLEEILQVPLNEKIFMIEETFYNEQGFPIGVGRHSILPEHFEFNITRSGI